MTGTQTDRVGFEPRDRARLPQRYAVSLEIIAGMALVVSTAVAATVVSIGIARADTFAAVPAADHSFALAVMLALIFAGWGGLTALMTRNTPPRD